jgi:hypothetical protein
VNALAMTLACRRRRVRPVLAGVDPLDHVQSKGVAAMNLDAVHEDDRHRRTRGRPAQRLLRQPAVISLLGIAIGTPLGIAAGTWLAEYGNHRKLGTGGALRQRHPAVGAVDRAGPVRLHLRDADRRQLLGAGRRDGTGLHRAAGGGAHHRRDAALVPVQMREAALSLGVPQWKVTMQVLYRSALPGIVTGVLLALARISGETAPLLFTAFGNQFWSTGRHRRDGERADGGVPVCDESLRILERAGLGRRLHGGDLRAAAEHAGARRTLAKEGNARMMSVESWSLESSGGAPCNTSRAGLSKHAGDRCCRHAFARRERSGATHD